MMDASSHGDMFENPVVWRVCTPTKSVVIVLPPGPTHDASWYEQQRAWEAQ